MFVSEKIVFVELQKTGCTHIAKLLSDILDGQLIGKHNRPTADIFTSNNIFIGSIRNPWDWYISLWAYGCDKKGGFYERSTRSRCLSRTVPKNKKNLYEKVMSPHCMREYKFNNVGYILLAFYNELIRNPNIWKRYYTNSDDIQSFRSWLKLVHNPKLRLDFGEGYGFSSIHKIAGLLTYRYLSLFCRNHEKLFTGKHLIDIQSLRDYERSNLYISHFIRNENLENDLINILNACGVPLTDNQKRYIFGAKKTNTSSRSHGPEYYYDKDTVGLVAEKEQLLIEKFGYKPPKI